MFSSIGSGFVSALIATVLASTASAQVAPPGAEDLIEGTIQSVNESARTITVRFEEEDLIETYPVAEDAEFYFYNGVMEVPREFNDLAVGQTVMLEFNGVEGEPTLQKVTTHDNDDDGG